MLPTRRNPQDFDARNPFARVVLGMASLGGLRGPVEKAEAVDTVLTALGAGVRRVDTAPAYGNAEEILGEALAQWKGERPWVSTKAGKYWESGAGRTNYSPAAVNLGAEESCRRLGVSQLDCLFAHEPERIPEEQKPALVAALGLLRDSGRVKMLGLGGGSAASWHGLIDTGVFSAAISFNRMSAVTSDVLPEDLPELRRAKAQLFGASLLHAGLLGDRAQIVRGKPPAFLSARALDTAVRLQDFATRGGWRIESLAHRFALSVWELDFLIIGPATRDQLEGTLAAFREGPLGQELFDAICALQAQSG